VVIISMLGCLLACGVPSSPELTPAASSTAEAAGTLTMPTQPVPSLTEYNPTPVPTLSTSMQWIEPQATNGIVLEVPNEAIGGKDIYLISPDGSSPMLLANLQGMDPLSVKGAPNGKWLAIENESISSKHEFFSENLLLLYLSTLELKPIVENTSIISYAWSPIGDVLAYTELLPEGAGERISVFDTNTGDHRVLFQSPPPGGWQVKGWVLEGKSLLVGHFLGNGLLFDEAALLDVSTGSLKKIYSDPDKLTQEIIPAPDGQVAVVYKRSPSNFDASNVFLLELASGTFTPLIAPDNPEFFIVSVPLWSPDGQRMALTVSDQPQSQKQEEGISIPLSIIVLDITGQMSEIIRIEDPPMLIRPLGWASDSVLIVNNLGGEVLDQIVYSMRDDGSHVQKVSWGRFLTTIPINP